jgi:hypothetical protein
MGQAGVVGFAAMAEAGLGREKSWVGTTWTGTRSTSTLSVTKGARPPDRSPRGRPQFPSEFASLPSPLRTSQGEVVCGEGAGMAGGQARLPPRWFVVTAWHVHRWIVRASRARRGLGVRARGSGAPCGSPLEAGAAASLGALIVGYFEGWAQPGLDGHERLGCGRASLVDEPAGPTRRRSLSWPAGFGAR